MENVGVGVGVGVCPRCRSRFGKAKISYDSSEEANAVASRLFDEDNRMLYAYKCPWGQGWHLRGEESEKKSRRIKCEIEKLVGPIIKELKELEETE